MRLLFLFTLIMLTAAPASAADTVYVASRTDGLAEMPRKKVAVVLSGGGAKGVAHIGALKVIERAGIPIDYIVGTSMGSIVGGLYSIGYDAMTLDSLVRSQDWKLLLSDNVDPHNLGIDERERQNTYLFSRPIIRNDDAEVKGGFISGHNLANLFSRLTIGYHDSIDFRNLPIPFACVATDMVTYEEIDITSGWLAQSMRASMAIPGVFSPVKIDSMVLVDGGLKNNYPVDVARRMGADLVIGVTVQGKLKETSELVSGMSILLQLVDYSTQNKYEENVSNTDVYIPVDVKGYSSTSFTTRAIDTLIRRGERAANNKWEELLRLKASLGLPPDYHPARLCRKTTDPTYGNIHLLAVDYNGVEKNDIRYITRKYNIVEGDSVTLEQIGNAVNSLRSDLMYSTADYSLRQMAGGYWLKINVGERKITQASVGVRFDNEEMVALQANTNFLLKTKAPIELDVTARLGKRYMGRVAATLMPANFRNCTLAYTFRSNDINIYSEGDRDYNVSYKYHTVDAALINITGKNYKIDLSAKWEYFHFDNMLTAYEREKLQLADEHFYSAHFRIYYNSENRPFFTTRGAMFEASYGVYTDNFTQYKDNNPVQAVSGMWRVATRLNSHLTLQPTVYGRIVWGKEVPWCLSNFVGGDFYGHYVDQQLPFSGVGNVEYADNTVIVAGLNLQQRVMDNNYIFLRSSAGLGSNKLKDIFKDSAHLGFKLGWAYDSFFGPISASLGYSNITKEMDFYINLGYQF